MPVGAGQRGKNWCFTLNNFTLEDLAQVYQARLSCTYLVVGQEKGESGTPHLQGYISFETRKTLTAVKQLLSTRAHLEVARGKADQNRTYCIKEGNYAEFGAMPSGQGSRADLDAIKASIDAGGTLNDVREICYSSYLRYQKAIKQDIERMVQPRTSPPEVLIYWGPTGTGKSRTAHERNPGAYWKPYGSKWFDGYERQSVCIIDEFVGWLPLTFILRLTDRYPNQVEAKGVSIEFTSEKVIFCSNLPWEEWWPNAKDAHKDAFRRRLSQVVHFNNVVGAGSCE